MPPEAIDTFELPPVHAITVATPGCAPLGLANSAFAWRGKGALPDNSATVDIGSTFESTPMKEATMPPEVTLPAADASPGAGPQFRIVSVLSAMGTMGHKQLSEYSQLKGEQLRNAIYNARQAGRIRKLNDGVFEITAEGHAYLSTNHDGADQKFAKTQPARKAVKLPAQLAAPHPSGLPTFVAAIASDGSFCLVKGDDTIKLNGDEYAEMRAYLARIGA